ncbi:hypothetical protein [Pseudoneobacillus sp. C159]
MKKVWKYVLAILLVLIIGTAGTVYYFINIKTYDVADEQIDEIIETEYDIVLPDDIVVDEPMDSNNSTENGISTSTDKGQQEDKTGDSSSNNTNNQPTTNSSKTNKPTSQTTTGGKSSTTSTNSNNANKSTSGQDKPSQTDNSTEAPVEVTVKNIKDKFRPVFKSLESQANGKIDALMSRAFNEYQQKKENGESISYSYFYQKYTSAGRDLENKTDGAFNYIYKALENDLQKHGYSVSHAKPFREQYEETKKDREAALFNKAKQAL